ncbi:MAG: shikimate kinase [Candidatus Omnitrophica bacterium]|nr:shikimate kinase [Candidatus Omnitrophota bacterium]
MKNIVLVGFMGTGKSAVGKRLARQLNMKFISTDSVIEEREGRPIAEIFEKSGEPYFRGLEKSLISEISKEDNAVIAAGGGAVLDNENMANLRKKGVIICLDAAPAVIYERTKKYKHRPLLNVEDPLLKIRELLDKRAPCYAKADYRVDTSDKSIDEVVGEVLTVIARSRRRRSNPKEIASG